MDVQFNFDELQVSDLGCGALFYGRAILTNDREDNSEFYVSRIVLDGGKVLKRRGHTSVDPFMETLFELIDKQIADEKTVIGKHAAIEWANHVSGRLPVGVNSAHRLELAHVAGAVLA